MSTLSGSTGAYLVAVAYSTVLTAELAGDKAIYTVSSLVTRFSALPVAAGIGAAFTGKILIAVVFGSLLSEFPLRLSAAISAATFFFTAYMLWRPEDATTVVVSGGSNALMVSFAAIFFSEWCDPGQMSTAALVARYHFAVPIFLGAACALLTKGALAMALGIGLRSRISRDWLRSLATVSCLVLGTLSLRELVVG